MWVECAEGWARLGSITTAAWNCRPQVVALAGFLRWFPEKLSGSWEVGFSHLLIVCLLSGDGKAYVILLSCHADAGSGQTAATRGIY